MSGYTECACRDCFDIAISNTDKPTLCYECDAAGCADYTKADKRYTSLLQYECQRDPTDETEEG